MNARRLPVASLATLSVVAAGLTWTGAPAIASGLPDGRAYEMVTPVQNDNAAVYAPSDPTRTGLVTTYRPFRASSDGDAVAYESEPTTGGDGVTGEGFGNAQLATRAPAGGWTQVTAQPNGHTSRDAYQGFSADLSMSVLNACNEPVLAPGAPLGEPGFAETYNVLYTRNTSGGSYRPLFTTTPPNRHPGSRSQPLEFGTSGATAMEGSAYGTCTEALVFAGASSDFNSLLFEANDALLEGQGALEKELDSDVKDEISAERSSDDLYVSVGGRLSLVNVQPDGAAAPNASFGGVGPDFSHVISADGSRIFWTDLNTGVVYVRVDGSSTVAVSAGPAQFWTASEDGRYAFYTEGEQLYRFDAQSQAREELTGAGAAVQGVIGASEDGGYAYFVADGSLLTDAVAGQPNLYAWHAGAVSFVATLSEADASDWSPRMGERTAGVAPDGHALVFMSARSLTGYANEGAQEVYVYQAEPVGLFCASCSQTGAAGSNGYLQQSWSNTYTPRWLSADGARVFFDSSSPLAAQDTDEAQDVYEWERQGPGCARVGGCVYLLSGGTGEASLIDASASGDDVFFVTTAQLVPEDGNEVPDLYDARVGGAPLAHSECSGTGCQGVPAAQPIFATPASVTFNGVGNFPSPAPTLKPAPKTRTPKCAKPKKLSHGKCVKNIKHTQKSKKVKAKKARNDRRGNS